LEQRFLWEHLSRKKNVETKTRKPSGSNHTNKIHGHSKTRGNLMKDTSRRKSFGNRNVGFNGSKRGRKNPNYSTSP
jgi:hypothetical protein